MYHNHYFICWAHENLNESCVLLWCLKTPFFAFDHYILYIFVFVYYLKHLFWCDVLSLNPNQTNLKNKHQLSFPLAFSPFVVPFMCMLLQWKRENSSFFMTLRLCTCFQRDSLDPQRSINTGNLYVLFSPCFCLWHHAVLLFQVEVSLFSCFRSLTKISPQHWAVTQLVMVKSPHTGLHVSK